MKTQGPVALVILDGYGYRKERAHNAIAQAHTPHFNSWLQQYPHALLRASGTAVGLPEGFPGNSEVGHLTIGAGKVIKQPLTTFLEVIGDRSIMKEPVLQRAVYEVQQTGGRMHIMGLLSDGGVHCMVSFLTACIEAVALHGSRTIFVHPFLDGRDVPPQSAMGYLESLEQFLSRFDNALLGSVHGRFYAMDRDNNWDRTENTYRVLTDAVSPIAENWRMLISSWYEQGITDEYIPPTRLHKDAAIKNGDGIIFCNVRPDRARQLATAFVDKDFVQFDRSLLNLSCFVTPVAYAQTLHTSILFPEPPIMNTLKDRLAAAHKRICSVAETEKYAHITYFFNGMREDPVAGETRLLIPSLPLKNYVDYPCMSAPAITDAVCTSLCTDPHDFYLINYANADMVGHSGDFDATVKAIECLDKQLARIYQKLVMELQGTLIITADHGKAEDMFDEKAQQPRTAHTNSPVPYLVLQQGLVPSLALPVHELADIKGHIEKLMKLD